MGFSNLSAVTFLPNPYDRERAATGRERWLGSAQNDVSVELAEDSTGSALLDAVFGNSPFLGRTLARHPDILCRWAQEGPEPCLDAALARLDPCDDERTLMTQLRIARAEVAAAVALSDISGLWGWREVTAALSRFAEGATQAALAHLLMQASKSGKLGELDATDPERNSGFIVLALGKLGGRELNYSSDIDLIVLWDDERLPLTSDDGPQSVCVRITRQLVRLLEERTPDGHVMRTDLRLRPDPGATPLALSADAAELYYEGLGQNWERAAMIKARPIAGDIEAGNLFLERLRPFIWRRHLDFAAIQDIHSIKRQIHAHKGGGQVTVAGHNVKLGRGGIREIEFFAQTQQLIFGGREPDLRSRPTCETLDALANAGRIAAKTAEDLDSAYAELRRIEHRLQMVDDNQTHSIPDNQAGIDHIATFLGYEDSEVFSTALTEILHRVEAHYGDLFEDSAPLSGDTDGTAGNLVFTGNEDDPDTLETLTRMGFSDGASVASVIRGWHHGRVRAMRSSRAREILTELVPSMLLAFAGSANPDAALMRFHEFLDRLPAGVQLFSLFQSRKGLLDLVAEIMGTAPRLAEHLARTPTLLDHVLSTDFYIELPHTSELEAELQSDLELAENEEDVLDRVRWWTHDREFQLGVQLLRGVIGPDDVAHGLTDLTDAVFHVLTPRVEAKFQEQHGIVPGGGMAVIAFGKYGARELNFGSDLDLVFVYSHDEDADSSDGPRPLPPSQYFIRLSQRIVTALTSMTNAGRLFDIDMRLRPSGNAGPLACDFAGFVRYQEGEAWHWEHLALTRARIVYGPGALAASLDAAIGSILKRERDSHELSTAVVDMRARITGEHRVFDRFDVKYVEGGLIDLDFQSQFLQLVHAARHPEVLSARSDRALQTMASLGILDAGQADDLIKAGNLMHHVQTAVRLAMARPTAEDDLPKGLCDLLVRVTGSSDFDDLCERLDRSQRQVKSAFDAVLPPNPANQEGKTP
jgi:[glutamine synthetase] adenylyltransferase / [glutamine synthetase]-adenylyl-L-tyrosine phosphorylase